MTNGHTLLFRMLILQSISDSRVCTEKIMKPSENKQMMMTGRRDVWKLNFIDELKNGRQKGTVG